MATYVDSHWVKFKAAFFSFSFSVVIIWLLFDASGAKAAPFVLKKKTNKQRNKKNILLANCQGETDFSALSNHSYRKSLALVQSSPYLQSAVLTVKDKERFVSNVSQNCLKVIQ